MGCDLVQGYYFSKPVPGEAFEHFLTERGQQSVELTTEVKKTCMSLSGALSSNFESIFYVDTLTDFYLEFASDAEGQLQIHPGGDDFFADAHAKLLKDVCGEDVEKLEEALKKENLMRWLEQEETVKVPFRRQSGSGVKPYCLQTIRTRSSNTHHIVIGVYPE
jgi:hypothetical protein